MNVAMIATLGVCMFVFFSFIADITRHTMTQNNPNSPNPSMGLLWHSTNTAGGAFRSTRNRSQLLNIPQQINTSSSPQSMQTQ